MDRRRFLGTTLATLPLCVVGCQSSSETTTENTAVDAKVRRTPFPTPTFVTHDPAFSDYRPAVDKTGEQVVFERTPFPNPGEKRDTELFVVRAIGAAAPNAVKLLPSPPAIPPVGYPFSQTRPDWSWITGLIAFNGAPSNATGPVEIHIATPDGLGLRAVANTREHLYPIWTSDGAQLIAFDSSKDARPAPPVTALIHVDGTPIVSNLNGSDKRGIQVFGGFAAPMPGRPTQIAFAGQPALAGWGADDASSAAPAYDQDNNYVFLNGLRHGAFASEPMEPSASTARFEPKHQGRAPYWSPDGRYVVFESSRAGGYALFLAQPGKGTPPRQLTDPLYWAQHGKFFPSGRKIVYTALQNPEASGKGPRGIATIDIDDFL